MNDHSVCDVIEKKTVFCEKFHLKITTSTLLKIILKKFSKNNSLIPFLKNPINRIG